jgi:hypothetical protein
MVVVDAAWPAWLGLEAWLLPWVVPLVVAQARRVAESPAVTGVVVFADEQALVNGFLDASAPPWRRNAREDAALARKQIDSITRQLREDPDVGPKVVRSSQSVRVDQPLEQIRAALRTDCDELYARSLVRGHGPSASAGLLVKRDGAWRVSASEALLEVLR